MARFERDGLSFEMPDGWHETSVISVSRPATWESPDVCNVLVTKEPLGEAESIDTRVRTKLMTFAQQLPAFEYIDTRETTVAGRRATVLSFRWGSDDGKQRQRLTAVECATPTGRAAIILSAVSSVANEAQNWAELDALVASVHFT